MKKLNIPFSGGAYNQNKVHTDAFYYYYYFQTIFLCISDKLDGQHSDQTVGGAFCCRRRIREHVLQQSDDDKSDMS